MRVDSPAGPGDVMPDAPPDEGRLPGRPRSRVTPAGIWAGPDSRFTSLLGGGSRAPPRRLLVRVLRPAPAGPRRRVALALPGRSAGPGASLRPRPRAAVPRRSAGGCEGRAHLAPAPGPGPDAPGAGSAARHPDCGPTPGRGRPSRSLAKQQRQWPSWGLYTEAALVWQTTRHWPRPVVACA